MSIVRFLVRETEKGLVRAIRLGNSLIGYIGNKRDRNSRMGCKEGLYRGTFWQSKVLTTKNSGRLFLVDAFLCQFKMGYDNAWWCSTSMIKAFNQREAVEPIFGLSKTHTQSKMGKKGISKYLEDLGGDNVGIGEAGRARGLEQKSVLEQNGRVRL